MSCHPLLAQLYRELRAQAPNVPACRTLLEARREAMLREVEDAKRIRFEWDDDEDAWWIIDNLDPALHPHAPRHWDNGTWQVMHARAVRGPYCHCCGKRHRPGFDEWKPKRRSAASSSPDTAALTSARSNATWPLSPASSTTCGEIAGEAAS